MEENPDIKAVVITSPTYDGVVSDIRSIADIVHRRGGVLIVDEAHGAHFGFHPGISGKWEHAGCGRGHTQPAQDASIADSDSAPAHEWTGCGPGSGYANTSICSSPAVPPMC